MEFFGENELKFILDEMFLKFLNVIVFMCGVKFF